MEQGLYAYFSERAAKECGTEFWLKFDGTEVEIVKVYISEEKAHYHFNWRDKLYLGRVKEFSREGREPNPPKGIPKFADEPDLPEVNDSGDIILPDVLELESELPLDD